MLLPGPEAQQLVTYAGWRLHGVRGGLTAGLLFVLPGAIALLVLSWLYVAFQNVTWIEAVFFGVKAAVLAVVLEAVLRIGKRALKSPLLVGFSVVSFLAMFVLQVSFPWIVGTAALTGVGLRPLDSFTVSRRKTSGREWNRPTAAVAQLDRDDRRGAVVAGDLVRPGRTGCSCCSDRTASSSSKDCSSARPPW